MKKLQKKKKMKKKKCRKILEEFFESDIQGSELFLREIFKIIKYSKKTEEKKEFIGNSFELTFSKKSVKILNQFNEKKCKISLEVFEEYMKKKFNF